MIRTLVVDEEAAEEAEAQARYYTERGGESLSLRFVVELEAVYGGLSNGRLVGVNHPSVKFRQPVKRVFLDPFPFAVVFFIENNVVTVVALEAFRKRPRYWRKRLVGR